MTPSRSLTAPTLSFAQSRFIPNSVPAVSSRAGPKLGIAAVVVVGPALGVAAPGLAALPALGRVLAAPPPAEQAASRSVRRRAARRTTE